MSELKELRSKAKKRGACRLYFNRCKRNIYFIDLMDFSSKQNKWVQDIMNESNAPNFNKNRGYKYVLVCIDGYSRYLMTRLLKTKSAQEVTNAMKDIIEKNGGPPSYINCDEGTEFVNSIFHKQILEKYNIKMYHMHSENKSIFAERVIRTIKEYIMVPFNMSKGIWYEYIDKAVQKHNNHLNKYTGYTPNQIWKEDYYYFEKDEPENMSVKDTTPQFNVGDIVRVYHPPSILKKKSLTFKWTTDLYEVTEIDDDNKPIMYSVKNCDSDSVSKTRYYHWQLLKSKCKPTTKSIIQTRTQSEKNPDKLKEVAQSHKPVTRKNNSLKHFGKTQTRKK